MDKTRMELSEAEGIARDVVSWLAPRCKRVEVVGSVRRKSAMVGDIEVLCIPKTISQPGFFDDGAVHSVLDDAPFGELGQCLKGGSRMKQIALKAGINLDLFVVLPPAQWGVLMMIRTGPARFSQWMVTQRQYGGALPSRAHVQDGAVWWDDGTLIPMPKESDYFEFCELLWIAPKRRMNQRLSVQGWGEHWGVTQA